MATTLSLGCHVVCKIFLVKSRLSTLISSRLALLNVDEAVAARLALRDGDALPPFELDELELADAALIVLLRFELTTRLGRSSDRGLLCSREHSYMAS